MSSGSTMRILLETSARLESAKDADEVRRIGIDHVRALGADFAATAYLSLVTTPDFTEQQQVAFLQETVRRLMVSIEGAFISQDLRDAALLADHLEAAEAGFVGQLNELFSVVRIGGSA